MFNVYLHNVKPYKSAKFPYFVCSIRLSVTSFFDILAHLEGQLHPIHRHAQHRFSSTYVLVTLDFTSQDHVEFDHVKFFLIPSLYRLAFTDKQKNAKKNPIFFYIFSSLDHLKLTFYDANERLGVNGCFGHFVFFHLSHHGPLNYL